MRDFKIPTEFNRADQIAGFTLPQLGIMGGGLAICGGMIASPMPILLSLIISLPIGIITCILMFFKKMNMPIYEYYIVKLAYSVTPRRMIYRKENKRNLNSKQEEISFLILDTNKGKVDEKEDEKTLKKTKKSSKKK
ncbi:hypothetical protein bcgnr5378_30070 [Bacillus cereus]|uniref:PrgI family protein n=1 Tax=Bacillus cereus TaxID=1396 RepID=A0A164QS48_BACCE|nr:PrgI family protein [Bacillus cereus]KZD72106.1 hypothetical protein B4088_0567 [Bacillus cereus]HDR8323543.1 PrgI family protein [Bacillus cereus]HDR8327301.1 PrgI family protein [Bacillus cereus]HDR8332983.1 PrgI family protein [Bacillus cereus]